MSFGQVWQQPKTGLRLARPAERKCHYALHLAGPHYLKDRAELNGSSQVIFNKILKRQISAEQIEKSKYYESPDYFCRSFFRDNKKDYSENQRRWTLLFKKKVWKKEREEIVLFEHPAWKARETKHK